MLMLIKPSARFFCRMMSHLLGKASCKFSNKKNIQRFSQKYVKPRQKYSDGVDCDTRLNYQPYDKKESLIILKYEN